MNSFDLPLSAAGIFTRCALSAARDYVKLVETQLFHAHAEMSTVALKEYQRIANSDETDYDNHVRFVDRRFEDDYRPILRFTEVVYLHMIFETYVSSHVDEIETLRSSGKSKYLEQIKKNTPSCGIAKAAKIYFQEKLHWALPDSDSWNAMCEIAELRNCLVHNAGMLLDSKDKQRPLIEKLELRQWQGQDVGIEISRYDDGLPARLPIIIHPRFVDYQLSLLDQIFDALLKNTHEEFYSKRPVECHG